MLSSPKANFLLNEKSIAIYRVHCPMNCWITNSTNLGQEYVLKHTCRMFKNGNTFRIIPSYLYQTSTEYAGQDFGKHCQERHFYMKWMFTNDGIKHRVGQQFQFRGCICASHLASLGPSISCWLQAITSFIMKRAAKWLRMIVTTYCPTQKGRSERRADPVKVITNVDRCT